MQPPFRSCLLALLVLPAPVQAQDAVPVHRESRHRLVLDSTRYRVLDVLIPPRDTTGYHTHGTAILYVTLAASPTAAQVLGSDWPAAPASQSLAAVGSIRIDSTYPSQPVTHRVTNVGTETFRLLAITSTGPAPASVAVGRDRLPGTVEHRSTWFRVSRVPVEGTARTGWFMARDPVLVVQPDVARLAIECVGSTRLTLAAAGSWHLVPARARCRIVNDASDPAVAVAIQIH